MSEIKNRLKSDIIAARKKQNKSSLEVLPYLLDRIEETERNAYISSKRPGSEYQPTFEEISNRRKALTLQEEARVVMNTIRSYEEEIKGLEQLKFKAHAEERRAKIKLLDRYLTELRKDPDQLDEILLDLCIKQDIVVIDDIPKAMKITEIELCFEDQSLIHKKLKSLLK